MAHYVLYCTKRAATLPLFLTLAEIALDIFCITRLNT